MIDLRDRVGVGRRAHAGLVGEEAAGDAVAGRSGHRDAGRPAPDRLGGEGAGEDLREHRRDVGGVHDDEGQPCDHIKNSHDGNELLRDGRDALHAAHEDGAGDDGEADADDNGLDVESIAEGVADGVGLDHVAHEPEGQDDGDGEEAREELRDGPVAEPAGDVVGRAADDLPRLVLLLIELC